VQVGVVEQPAQPGFVEAGLEDQGKPAGVKAVQGMEADGQADVGVDGAERIGTDGPDPARADLPGHLFLKPSAVGADLGKTPGHQDDPPDPLADAVVEQSRRLGLGHGDHGQIGNRFDPADVRIGLDPQDFLLLGVHGVDRPRVSQLEQIGNEVVARAKDIFGSADQGDAGRIEEPVKKMGHDVLHLSCLQEVRTGFEERDPRRRYGARAIPGAEGRTET